MTVWMVDQRGMSMLMEIFLKFIIICSLVFLL
jgi:hypothetical protein